MTISMPVSKPARAAAAVCLSGVMWGLWWIPVRGLARHGLEGDWISVAVYAMASLLLAPFAFAKLRARRGESLRFTLAGSFSFGAALTMTNTALLNGEVVRVLLLFYLAPIWATLIDVFVLKERLVARRVATVALGLGGAAVVLGAGGVAVPLPRSLGDWMGLSAGVMFAVGALCLRKAETTASANDPLIQSFVSFVVGCLLGFVFLAVFPPAPVPIAGIGTWAPAAGAVTVVWLLPQMWLFMWGAGRLPPGRVAILMLAEPMAAVASAALLLDEPFGIRELAGCVLIVAAGMLETLGAPAATKG